MPSFIERLARRVVNLETKVNRALTSPQLGNSSLEDGTLEEYDGDGQLVTIIGKQPDGTHGAVVVSGPVPPRPSAPAVAPGPGLLSYGWDGNFADEATGETDITIPAPMDFGRVEAHASKFQGFAADTAATLLDTLESPRGGSRTVMLDPGTWFVKLVTRALSGKRSEESLEVSVEVFPPSSGDVDVDALREEFQAADAQLNEALGQLAVSKIGLDRLDADGQLTTVVADQMFSDLFATRKLYANQVLVGQPGNLHPDPGFNDPGVLARMAANSTCQVTLGGSGDLQLTNPGGALQLFRPMGTAPTLVGVLSNGWTAVTPGDVWSFSLTVSSWQGTTGGIRFLGRGANGSTEVPITGFTPINAATGRFTLEVTVPTGCRWILPEVLVARGVSYANRGTIVLQQKITPSLIVDGFFQGLRVIGASIETNAAANTGLKLTDDGLVAHGAANDYDPVGQINIGYNTKASIDIRQPAWTAFPSDRVPGLWFDSVKQGAAGAPPPAVPAAVMASNAPAQGVRIQSSQQSNELDYRSALVVDQNLINLVSQSNRADASSRPADQASFTVFSTGWELSSDRSDGTRKVAFSASTYDGVLRLSGTNITANGESLTNITRARLTLTNGYTHWTSAGWNGLWYERLGKMVIISGAVGNQSAWPAGNLIAIVPTELRPANKTQGINCEMQADGSLQTGSAGSGATAMSITYFLP